MPLDVSDVDELAPESDASGSEQAAAGTWSIRQPPIHQPAGLSEAAILCRRSESSPF